MRRGSLFGSLASVSLCIALIAPLSATRPVRGPRSATEVFRFAEAFVKGTYPGLAGDPSLQFSACTFGSWDEPWRFRQLEVYVHPGEIVPIRSDEEIARTLLIVTFRFDERGLRTAYASGSYVSYEQRNTLAETIAVGEPWALDKLREHLRGIGARYVDDVATVAAALPHQTLTKLFGSIRIHAGHMLAPSENVKGGDSLAGQWQFTMDATEARATYHVFVEPFNGRLRAILRVN